MRIDTRSDKKHFCRSTAQATGIEPENGGERWIFHKTCGRRRSKMRSVNEMRVDVESL